MKKQGLAETTIKVRVYRLKHLARKGANLMDPDSLLTVLATNNWSESNKRVFIVAYQGFASTYNLQWKKPKARVERKVPFIPSEDFIVYLRSKEVYIGIQIKNRLEYPRMNDVHLLLDMCRILDLIPVLVTRLSHPRSYSVFSAVKGDVIQTKRYFLQPPFPREAFLSITRELHIPLGVYQWVPDFLISDVEALKAKL